MIKKYFTELKDRILETYTNCDICEYIEDYDWDENDVSYYQWCGKIEDILAMISETEDKILLEENITCNYHINDRDKLVICGCTQEPIASTFSWFNEQTSEYKYCPYCGKEIRF